MHVIHVHCRHGGEAGREEQGRQAQGRRENEATQSTETYDES